MVKKDNLKNTQDIQESENAFDRIKYVWLFNREKIQKIPYIKDLFQEALIIYLIPVLAIGIGIFLTILPIQELNLSDYVFLPVLYMIDELISLLSFLLVLYVCMKLILPGFPSKSYATLEMVFISFSYVYLIRIIGIFGLFLGFSPILFLFIITFYMIYLVVVASFTTKSLTGANLWVSLFVGFALFFSIIAFRLLLALF